jgi:hypothetical protein
MADVRGMTEACLMRSEWVAGGWRGWEATDQELRQELKGGVGSRTAARLIGDDKTCSCCDGGGGSSAADYAQTGRGKSAEERSGAEFGEAGRVRSALRRWRL